MLARRDDLEHELAQSKRSWPITLAKSRNSTTLSRNCDEPIMQLPEREVACVLLNGCAISMSVRSTNCGAKGADCAKLTITPR